MAEIDLISSGFWQSSDCKVMVNLKDYKSVSDARVIQQWASQEPLLETHILFSTSGSTGSGKWVALSRDSILASARTVNSHLKVTENDCWLLALPDFHVGGMGVYARCYEAGCSLVKLEGRWDAQLYHDLAEEQSVTLSALVPTQLVDLVDLGLRAPENLRALIIGGGRLDDGIYDKAISLGWPIIETYGMTETCSQVATSQLGERVLKILPSWETKLSDDGRLMLRGELLMTGYVSISDEICSLQRHEGWLTTNDLVKLEGGSFSFVGRFDRCVKVLGELVNLAEMEQSVSKCAEELGIFLKNWVVISVPHVRSENQVIACCEEAEEGSLQESLDLYHQHCAPFRRIKKIFIVHEIPRSSLGKVRYAELKKLVSSC